MIPEIPTDIHQSNSNMRFSLVVVVASAMTAVAAPIGASVPESGTALVGPREEVPHPTHPFSVSRDLAKLCRQAGANAAASPQHHDRHWTGDDGRSCSGYWRRKRGYMHINRNSWASSPKSLGERITHCVAGMLLDESFGDVEEGTVAHYYPGVDPEQLTAEARERGGVEEEE